MAFIDQRLAACVAYGFSGGPEWQTQLVMLNNGREQRNADWLYPRHRYSAEFLNLSKEGRDAILAAFHACRGRLHVFRFKDWNDFTATDEPLAPTIGTSAPVQLLKQYSLGIETATRLIQAPVSAIIRRNGESFAGTLDLATALFTPGTAWTAATYTWSGEFDVWVRFDSDFNVFTIGAPNAHTSQIDLVEVRR